MNAMSQYQNNQVTTATPEQILIMLYDGAIRFVAQTKLAIEEKNIEKKNMYINKTIAILSELSATLDHKIGGEIAANLASLYDFMIKELHGANLRNDQKRLNVVSTLLTELRDTWVQAIAINRREKNQIAPDKNETAQAGQPAQLMVNV